MMQRIIKNSSGYSLKNQKIFLSNEFSCVACSQGMLAQIIRLLAHFPYYLIKSIRLDNAGEFTSQDFNDYFMSIGITVEHPVGSYTKRSCGIVY